MKYTYYGRYDDKKPTQGVHFLMFEEHIKKAFDHELHKFEKEVEKKWISTKRELDYILKDIKELKDKYAWVVKHFAKEEIKKISDEMLVLKEESILRKSTKID